jgi:hypothetical protein
MTGRRRCYHDDAGANGERSFSQAVQAIFRITKEAPRAVQETEKKQIRLLTVFLDKTEKTDLAPFTFPSKTLLRFCQQLFKQAFGLQNFHSKPVCLVFG